MRLAHSVRDDDVEYWLFTHVFQRPPNLTNQNNAVFAILSRDAYPAKFRVFKNLPLKGHMDPNMSDSPLFFTDPDDFDVSSVPAERIQQDVNVGPLGSPQPEVTSISSQHVREKRLFFPDSDDETIPTFDVPRDSTVRMIPLVAGANDDSGSELELPPIEEVPRASSVSSISSMVSRDSSPPQTTTRSSPPPTKKRRLSSSMQPKPTVKSNGTYLGTFLVPNAWSTVKGKGYINPGEEVRIERDSPEDTSTTASIKGKKKQLTLKAMLKSQPVKNVKRKADTIVRLTNKGGFGE